MADIKVSFAVLKIFPGKQDLGAKAAIFRKQAAVKPHQFILPYCRGGLETGNILGPFL